MALAAKQRRIKDPTRGNPFVNLTVWPLLGAVVAFGLGFFSDPATGGWIYALVGGAAGLGIGCFVQFSDSAFAEAFRFSGRTSDVGQKGRGKPETIATRVRTLTERMERLDVPFLALLIYTLVPAVVGTVVAFMAPDRSVMLFAGVPAAIGFGVGLVAEFTKGFVSELLRWPARVLVLVVFLIGGTGL